MALYRVNFEITIMIVADSITQAESKVYEGDCDCTGEISEEKVKAYEVKYLNEVPLDWRKAVPYGTPDEETCEEILNKTAEFCF